MRQAREPVQGIEPDPSVMTLREADGLLSTLEQRGQITGADAAAVRGHLTKAYAAEELAGDTSSAFDEHLDRAAELLLEHTIDPKAFPHLPHLHELFRVDSAVS